VFLRRRLSAFLHSDRTLQRIYGSTTQTSEAGPDGARGTDTLGLLIFALNDASVARIVINLGVDRETVIRRARALRAIPPSPGLNGDAKRVVEAVRRRALARHQHSTATDLFVALAETPGRARDLLLTVGLDTARLAAVTK
jgi:hypothetical protein